MEQNYYFTSSLDVFVQFIKNIEVIKLLKRTHYTNELKKQMGKEVPASLGCLSYCFARKFDLINNNFFS